jgi:Uma2 family endonuclease
MTLQEWADLDEDVEGELVDGLLEEDEAPTTLHELVVSCLNWLLRSWLVPRGGLVLGSEHKLAVSSARGRKPDLAAYFPGSKKPPARAKLSMVPPDLVVEVVSPRPRDGRRDRVDKKREYAAFGVPWYWLVDPELRTLEVLRLGTDGHYADALSAATGSHDAPGIEGLTIDLDALWAEADQLPDGEDEPKQP